MNATAQELLSNLLNDLPDEYLPQVVAFVETLKQRADDPVATHLASEAVLANDWLKPEEDEAWASL